MTTESIDNPVMKESKWVKTMSTRMRVFNHQIFDVIYKRYSKENKEWHDKYLEYNFNHLNTLAYFDESVGNDEYFDWVDEYESNVDKLQSKELKEKENDELV